MRWSINSYDIVTGYSVDVSMLFLCVITQPFSHFDDDLLPCVTALSSKLMLENRESYSKHKRCEKRGIMLTACTTICTYMHKHIHDWV